MTTTAAPTGSLKQPPPRPAHPDLAQRQQQQQQQQPRQSFSRVEPPGGPGVGSAAMRALQLLRETQPRPSRRQSLPAGLSPRGLPLPLPQIGRPRAMSVLTKNPTYSPLVGKPPPPAARRASMAAPFDNTRRHSAGNVERPALLGTVRPPPPRGPPPPASGTTTTATTTTAISPLPGSAAVPIQAANVRRRSTSFRGPPPGPPPPARRASVALAVPSDPLSGSTEPWASRLTQPPQQQQQHQQQQPWEKAAAAAGASKNMGVIREAGGGPPVSRRVSFSTYKGPPILNAAGDVTTGVNEVNVNNSAKQESGVGGGEGAGATNVVVAASTPQPLPKLQRRQSSQMTIINGASPGKPPPPRPQGPPGGSPAEQIRRYSISNELPGGFSRRMSAVSTVGGSPDVTTTATAAENSLASAAQTHLARGGMPTSSDGTNAPIGQGTDMQGAWMQQQQQQQQQQQLPVRRASLEGRGAVLWYNMGVTKQKERDAKGAVECYERAANEGHAKAQHNLAAIYEKGVPGVPKNDVEAARLFRQAADQGLAESCYSYAMHLKFGLGIEQDDAGCVYYLEQASASGLVKAMFNLGLMYEKHRGVSADAAEADLLEATRECYQAAAEAGITKAMVNLGVLCMSGRLPGREQGEALQWFKQAADEGDVSGLWNLSLCYERGVGVAQDTVAAQALQQQCRDREEEPQPRRSSSVAIGEPQRRSSLSVVIGGAESLNRRSSAVVAEEKQNRRSSAVIAEEKQNRRSSSVVGGAAAMIGAAAATAAAAAAAGNARPPFPRRSSESSSALSFAPAKPTGGNIVGVGEKETSRRRSSSIPGRTPPPPQGPPPAATLATYRKSQEPKNAAEPENIAASEPGAGGGASSKGYKYTPNDERTPDKPKNSPAPSDPSGTRRYSITGDPAANGRGEEEEAVAGWVGGDSVPSPNRERRNSFLLKPTPQAIARVKAAVDRRRKQEAAAVAASTNASINSGK